MATVAITMFLMLMILFLAVVLRFVCILWQKDEAVEIDIRDVERWGPEIQLQDPICRDE